MSVSNISLKLQAVYPPGGSLSGALTVQIQGDSSANISNPVPTSPNGAPVSSSAAVATGTLDLSQIDVNNANYYQIDFSGPVDFTGGKIYWIVASVSYAAGSANYVTWRGGTLSFAYYNAGYQLLSGGQVTPLTPAGHNLDFRFGC
jgi:hypothetical protein